jgi:8-oxo-dGTP pyrophosphatase MutT (NUDIX family)
MINERYNVRVILFREVDDLRNIGLKKKEFLLLFARKRYWQFPQGGIETGENLFDAARREVREECGLRIRGMDIDEDSIVKTMYYAQRSGDAVKIYLRAIPAEVVDGSDNVFLEGRKSDGHTNWQWACYDRVINLLTEYPEQRKVFEEVCKKAKLG